MNDPDSLLVSIDRSARSVARWSVATKVIAGVMLFVATIMMLYAFSRADRHMDDFVGFGLISIGIAGLALVFGSIAAFHTAFGDVMRLAAATHIRIELLARFQEHQAARAAMAAAPPRAETPPTQPAEPAGAERPASAGAASAPASPPATPQNGSPAPAPAAAKAEPPAQKTPAEPAMKTCPKCREEIRAEALRCRNCFARV